MHRTFLYHSVTTLSWQGNCFTSSTHHTKRGCQANKFRSQSNCRLPPRIRPMTSVHFTNEGDEVPDKLFELKSTYRRDERFANPSATEPLSLLWPRIKAINIPPSLPSSSGSVPERRFCRNINVTVCVLKMCELMVPDSLQKLRLNALI